MRCILPHVECAENHFGLSLM